MRRNLVTIKNVHFGLIGQNGLNVQPHVEEAPGTVQCLPFKNQQSPFYEVNWHFLRPSNRYMSAAST